MMGHFPLTYFSAVISPKKAFLGRHNLKWGQNILVVIFLSALLVIPVTCFYAFGMKQMPLNNFLQENITFLNEQSAEKTSLYEKETKTTIFYEDKTGEIGSNLPMAKMGIDQISFTKDGWQVTTWNKEKPLKYQINTDISKVKNIKSTTDLKNYLGKTFYESNRPVIVLSYSWSLGLIILLITASFAFGASFFLYLTKKSRFSSIKTYQESLNLILNILGLPTLAAMIFGLIHFDFTQLLFIQSIGGVFMLLGVWAKTRFKDKELNIDVQTTI